MITYFIHVPDIDNHWTHIGPFSSYEDAETYGNWYVTPNEETRKGFLIYPMISPETAAM